jgi:hypothetical protein
MRNYRCLSFQHKVLASRNVYLSPAFQQYYEKLEAYKAWCEDEESFSKTLDFIKATFLLARSIQEEVLLDIV